MTWSGLTSVPSVFMTASLRVAAHRQEMPSLAEVGRSTTPGGIKLSLPDNLSRIPGKRTASRGWSTVSPSITRLNTAGCSIRGTRRPLVPCGHSSIVSERVIRPPPETLDWSPGRGGIPGEISQGLLWLPRALSGVGLPSWRWTDGAFG